MSLIDTWRKKHLGSPREDEQPREDEKPRLEIPQENPTALRNTIKTPEYFDSLSACIGPARLRQTAFGELIVRDRDWKLDFARGELRFGEDAYPIQFLGTESYADFTWQWAFAGAEAYPEAILAAVGSFYARCMEEGMEELRGHILPLSPLVNGHNIASMAASIDPAGACYYRCPYENGAAYVLVGNLPDAVFAPAPVEKVVSTITDIIRQLPLHHGALAGNLLADNCAEVTQGEDGSLVGRFADGATLTISFDEMGRIISLKQG
jgi:hypothetical protein